MALICSPCGNCHLVNHKAAFSESFVSGVNHYPYNARPSIGYNSRPELFCVPQPRIVLSAGVSDNSCTPHQHSGKRHRKRRRSRDLNAGELAAMEYHQQIEKTLEAALSTVILSSAGASFFSEQSSLCTRHKPADSKSLVLLGHGDNLVELSRTAAQLEISTNEENFSVLRLIDSADHESLSKANIFGCMVEHCCASSCQVTMLGKHCLLPPQCSFLMSDVSQLHTLVEDCKDKPYDLVVMDPPWENKSVARSQRYDSLSVWQLKRLPVSRLTAPHALVVIWVTNRRFLIKNICEQLLPGWRVHLLAEWHWLKVTCCGEPVVPMESSHKRPYETLLVCRRCCQVSDCSACQICCPAGKANSSDEYCSTAGDISTFNSVPAKRTCFRISTEEGTVQSGEFLDTCLYTDEENSLQSLKTAMQSYNGESKTSRVPVCERNSLERQASRALQDSFYRTVEDGAGVYLATNQHDEKSKQDMHKEDEGSQSKRCGEVNSVGKGCEVLLGRQPVEFDPVWHQHTIISIPCAIHSHKPPLHDILSPYLPEAPRCLELFARSLRTGWTSWGNEVIRLQHVNFFNEVEVNNDKTGADLKLT